MPANDGSNIYRFPDYQQKPLSDASSGTLKSGGGGGTSGGMDGWQTSVEARLGEIRTDTRSLLGEVNAIKVNLATLTERVAHLPSKGFVVTAVLTSLTVIAALVVFQGQIQTFLKISH
jgi:hypothetical protein